MAATLIVERDGDVIGDLYLDVRDGWAQRDIADRTRIIGVVCGCIVCAVGVGWLIVQAPGPFGELLTLAGAIFAGSMLIGWWVHRRR